MPHGLPFLSFGYLGVDFFFLLSGFILARAYGDRFARQWRGSDYLSFVRRRAWRLLPLHWTVLATVALSQLISVPSLDPGSMLQEFALMSAWYPRGMVINPPDWSLSAEWAANLIFPLLAFMMLDPSKSGRHRAILGVCAAFAALLLWTVFHHGSLDSTVAPFAVVRCICEFSTGMALFRFRAVAPALTSDRMLLLVIVGAAIAIGLRLNDLIAVIAMATGLVGVAGNRAWFSKLLSASPVHWLGKVSYSIYLVHFPVIVFVRHLLPANDFKDTLAVILISVPAVIAISALTYRHVELRFKDGLGAMRATRHG
jgi:peptidoglycan/LPS O-acetylase OafA/YrhL